ncbi:MAG: hypothetical protein J7L04_09965, partial [Bacteroidales bacterium]|nr:hypothetical protein [Bacteroidales bacterium]
DDITLKNIKVLTPAGSSPEWNDGLAIGSTRNLLIDGCFVYANDDPISSGHNFLPYDNQSSENFQIQNSFFWNPRANGFRLGWALNSYFGEIDFRNCVFSGNNNSAFIIHPHQKMSNMCYPKIRFEDCSFEDVSLYNRPLMWVDGACIKSLELVNVNFDAEPKINAIFHGSENGGIEKLLFNNVMIGGKKLTEENCNFDIKNTGEVVFY